MVQGCLLVYNKTQLREFINWIEGRSFVTPRGWYTDLNLYHRANYILEHCNLPETGNYDKNHNGYTGEYGGEFGEQLMNPATFVSNYLYHNCPLEFVQDWLKYAYNGKDDCKGTFEEISTSLELPNFEPATKIKVLRKGKSNKPVKYFYINMDGKKHKVNVTGMFHISIRDLNNNWFYHNTEMNHWILPDERDYKDTWTISTNKSVKAIIKMILKHWKLPKNSIIKIVGGKADKTYDWTLITK